MKLVPTSVILLLSALSAQAAVTVADGKVYDVGKGNYSADPGVENNADHLLCWAATAANVFQHWQDRYLTATAGIPNGIVPDAERLSYPGGTQYLEIYQAFLPNFKDKGGLFSYAVDWYFNGKSGSYLNAGAAKGGYLPGKVDSTYYAYWTEKQNNTFTNMAELKYALDQAFRSEGVAVYLGIITPSNSGHAITCWGYETDADGNLNALYVTDSDDRHYGARRVDLHVEENGKISLSSEYTGGSYSSGTYTINEVSMLVPKTGTTFAAKTANPTLDALPADGGITQARDITGKRLSSEGGATTLPESMLVSSGGQGTSLTLGGGADKAAGNGFTALAGSMVSLNNADIRISRFAGDGVSVQCEVNLSGGSVEIRDNGGTGFFVRGTLDNPKAFLRMCDNSSIGISGNAQGALFVGRGYLSGDKEENGVVRNAALLRHNGSVTISGNGAAAQNAVVYNAGVLTFADNASVTFSGNSARYDIYNEHQLTLEVNEGQSITFQHGIKNSATGTASLYSESGTGTYAFRDGASAVTLTFAEATIGANGGAVMEDGTLSLSDVAFTGPLTVDFGYFADHNRLDLSNVTLASGSTLFLTLDLGSGAGKLTPAPFASFGLEADPADPLTEVRVSLADYLTGDTSALAGVDLSLTVTGTLADDAMLVIDTAGFALSPMDVEVPDCKYMRTSDGRIYYGAPEPATATLSMVALTALCSRRRRSGK